VKLSFAQEEFNSCGLLTLLVNDPANHQFYILTLILALEGDSVSCLWTPVEGLTEYFKTANGGELRLELSLDTLGQLIDLKDWGKVELIFYNPEIEEGRNVEDLILISGDLMRVDTDKNMNVVQIWIDVETEFEEKLDLS
jgi:hypothetical protein